MEKIINKNILVFDLETSGLPYSSNNKKFKKNKDDYPNYKNNKSYNNARIVSIAWCYIKNFSGNIKKNKENKVVEFIRKPVDFYEINNSFIHNITYEKAKQEAENVYNVSGTNAAGNLIIFIEY